MGQIPHVHVARVTVWLQARKRCDSRQGGSGMPALFVVRHRHEAARCPAQDPTMGATLLNYLSRPNVRRHGIEIQGEAVVRGKHTLFMIVKADDEERVRTFMQPFAMAGTVEVLPALTC